MRFGTPSGGGGGSRRVSASPRDVSEGRTDVEPNGSVVSGAFASASAPRERVASVCKTCVSVTSQTHTAPAEAVTRCLLPPRGARVACTPTTGPAYASSVRSGRGVSGPEANRPEIRERAFLSPAAAAAASQTQTVPSSDPVKSRPPRLDKHVTGSPCARHAHIGSPAPFQSLTIPSLPQDAKRKKGGDAADAAVASVASPGATARISPSCARHVFFRSGGFAPARTRHTTSRPSNPPLSNGFSSSPLEISHTHETAFSCPPRATASFPVTTSQARSDPSSCPVMSFPALAATSTAVTSECRRTSCARTHIRSYGSRCLSAPSGDAEKTRSSSSSKTRFTFRAFPNRPTATFETRASCAFVSNASRTTSKLASRVTRSPHTRPSAESVATAFASGTETMPAAGTRERRFKSPSSSRAPTKPVTCRAHRGSESGSTPTRSWMSYRRTQPRSSTRYSTRAPAASRTETRPSTKRAPSTSRKEARGAPDAESVSRATPSRESVSTRRSDG